MPGQPARKQSLVRRKAAHLGYRDPSLLRDERITSPSSRETLGPYLTTISFPSQVTATTNTPNNLQYPGPCVLRSRPFRRTYEGGGSEAGGTERRFEAGESVASFARGLSGCLVDNCGSSEASHCIREVQ